LEKFFEVHRGISNLTECNKIFRPIIQTLTHVDKVKGK